MRARTNPLRPAPPREPGPRPALSKPRLSDHALAPPFSLTRVTSRVGVASCSAECSSRGQDELPVQRQELRKARAEVARGPATPCDQLTPPGHKGEPKLRDLGGDPSGVRAGNLNLAEANRKSWVSPGKEKRGHSGHTCQG